VAWTSKCDTVHKEPAAHAFPVAFPVVDVVAMITEYDKKERRQLRVGNTFTKIVEA
jgi:hypothetical protein